MNHDKSRAEFGIDRGRRCIFCLPVKVASEIRIYKPFDGCQPVSSLFSVESCTIQDPTQHYGSGKDLHWTCTDPLKFHILSWFLYIFKKREKGSTTSPSQHHARVSVELNNLLVMLAIIAVAII